MGILSWSTLWFLMLFGHHGLLYLSSLTESESLATFSLCCFCFSRPLAYTLIAVFTGRTFGFRTFGTLYGLVCSLAGTINGLGLAFLSEEVDKGVSFNYLNLQISIFQGLAILLPVYIIMDRIKTRRRSSEKTATATRGIKHTF